SPLPQAISNCVTSWDVEAVIRPPMLFVEGSCPAVEPAAMRAFAVRDLKNAQTLVVAQLPSGHAQIIPDRGCAPRDEMVNPPLTLFLAPNQSVGQQPPNRFGKLRLLVRR